MSMPYPFFQTTGASTYVVPVTNASSTALQIVGNGSQIRISNAGPTAVAFVLGTSAVGAAVFPADGAPTATMVILPGVVEVFSAPVGAYIRAITPSSTATLYVSRGEGV